MSACIMLWMHQRGWKQDESSGTMKWAGKWLLTWHFRCPRAFPSAPNIRIGCWFPIGLHQRWEHHIFYSSPHCCVKAQFERVTEREGGKKGNLFICWFSAVCHCLLLVFYAFLPTFRHWHLVCRLLVSLHTHRSRFSQFHNITQAYSVKDLNTYFIYKKQINPTFCLKGFCIWRVKWKV